MVFEIHVRTLNRIRLVVVIGGRKNFKLIIMWDIEYLSNLNTLVSLTEMGA